MRYDFFDSLDYKKKQAKIAQLNWTKGLYSSLLKKEERNCKNLHCKKIFIVHPSDRQKYCSKNCWNIVKRNYVSKTHPICIVCSKTINQRGASKFCSNKCQARKNYNEYIIRWQNGMENGVIGVTTQVLSNPIKRYIKEKYGTKCSLCGWSKKHPTTNVVPLEIDHIDGNSNNNKEENLRLICPNCHALTSTFKNLNKGHGRSWRLKTSNTFLQN